MADSAGILSSKNSEKSKLTNSVSRTTSETLRLADPDKVISQPNSLSTSTPKKKTSFQITSVIVGCKSSNDGGDDSADDLDESHTEDISEVVDNSRVTDIENETPSYSEDTFSKDDVFFNASSSLVSAPVIPTSSQYGLAILASTENSESASNQIDNCENSGTSVEVTESVINLGVVSTKHDPEMRDMHPPAPRTERFKVVKIESTEPFKRGRWVCMDYLDHNIAQNQASSGKTDSDSSHQNTLVSESKVGQESSSVSVNSVSSVITTEEVVQTTVSASAPTTVAASATATATAATVTEPVSNNNPVNIQPADSNQTLVNNMPISAPSTMPSSYASVSPGQSLQNNMQMASNTVVNSGQPQGTQQAQSLSQVHMQQILANSNQHQSLQSQQMQQVLANANVMPMQQQQSQQPQQTQQQQPQQQQQQQQQQAPPQQPTQPQQPQMQNQQTIQQQPIMQQPMQQMPSMHQPQQQYQPQQQQPMAQQQQFQPMQQQSMMPQQIPTQQSLQPQLQQVHMQQNIPQGMQQMPMQQQQGQQVQQQQMMQQQMQQMPQQSVHQVSYSQTQPTIVSQPSAQPQIPPGMLTHQMHAQMQNFQQNQMLTTMQQPIMTIQSQPHLQPQYYPASMPQTSSLPGGMMPPMSQGSSLPVSMQGSSVTLPPLQTYTSIQQVPTMPQTPPVQTSVQYSLPCSIAGQQPPSVQPITQQPLPNLMQQQTPQSYASIGSPAQSYGSSVMSSLPTSVTEPMSGLISSIGSSAEHPPLLSTVPTDYMPAPTAALLESLAEVTATPDEQQPTEDPESLRGLARALASAALELQPPAVPHSASGASAVAIDNKIEQAMDLVKSHLMYAVREEVEVLKEKIAELMERITQLESENNILRAGATPETLAQLPPPQPQQTNNPS